MLQPAFIEQGVRAPATRRLSSVATAKRRGISLHVDVALLTTTGLTHSGACLYAAFSYLWFENVSDATTLAKLEHATGRRRLDPIVVTAAELFPLTGLKKDGVASRIRELEASHPCAWGTCTERHPLISVRRIGQGHGLRIQRFVCGSPVPTARKRPSRQSAGPARSGGPIDSSSRCPETMPLTLFGGRDAPPLDDAPCVDQDPSGARSIHNGTLTTERNKAAAAANDITEQDPRRLVSASIADDVASIARMGERPPTESQLRRITDQLAVAAYSMFPNVDSASLALKQAMADARVLTARTPIMMLVRGVVGIDGANGRDAFLLKQPVPKPTESNSVTGDAFAKLAPALQEALVARMRAHQDTGARWLSERGISPAAVEIARARLTAETPQYPLGDHLRATDPAGYARRLQLALEHVDLAKFIGVTATLENPIFAHAARLRLENDLQKDGKR